MSEANELQKRLKTITTSIIKAIECPICLETLNVPLKLCIRGHMCCSGCVKTLNGCPTCEGDFIIENPVGLKALLEALPRLCFYSDIGCQEVIEPGNDHDIFCGFRTVACREPLCTDVVLVNQLLKHYETNHPKRFIIKEEDENMKWPEFNHKSDRKDDVPIYILDDFFWLSMINDTIEEMLSIRFVVVPNGKPDYDYYAKIKFEKGLHIYYNTLKATFITSAKKIDKIGKQEIETISEEDVTKSVEGENEEKTNSTCNKYCMKIPQEALHHFIDKNNTLKFNMTIFRECRA